MVNGAQSMWRMLVVSLSDTMRRTFRRSSLQMLTLTLLALPNGVAA